ncbi:LysR substrate-binding domain-containing protein [Pseudomonas sp. NPDC007930]|uniref:LysR family transcriptional regulator n=1 Tax=Pseudomonas sp. NPDC007930 TaxID=3364417 RepID=UPI0036F04A97
MDRLRSLQTFVTAADLGSFNHTARLLGVTPQAVSKAVRELERDLGVRLFHRSTRTSTLTEEGARFLEQLRGGLDTVTAAWAQAQASQSSAGEAGLIRIACGSTVARRVLVPLIAEFRSLNPGADFDLVVEDRFTHFVAAGIDVGFRSGFAPDAQVIARELMRMQLVPCASPAYLDAHGMPRTLADLARHTCTGFRLPNTGRLEPWEFKVDGEMVFQNVVAPFCTNDPETELQLLLQGLGIGLIDLVTAGPELRAGRLVPVLCSTVSERFGVFMYYAQRTQMPRRVRNFIDFVAGKPGLADSFRFSPGELQALQDQYSAENSLRR